MNNAIQFVTSVALIVLLSSFAIAQNGPPTNEQRAINRANRCHNYHGQNVDRVEATLDGGSICFVSGNISIYKVTVYFTCTPLISCIPAPPKDVAYVTFDCDGRVSNVECIE